MAMFGKPGGGRAPQIVQHDAFIHLYHHPLQSKQRTVYIQNRLRLVKT